MLTNNTLLVLALGHESVIKSLSEKEKEKED
jgi:hypothetical protein